MRRLEVKCESNINGVTEEIGHHWHVDRPNIWDPGDMQPKELSEGKLTDMHKESNCDEKEKDVPKE